MDLQWIGRISVMLLEVRIGSILEQEMGDLFRIDRLDRRSQCEEAQAAKGSTSSSQGVAACSCLYCK